MIEPAQFGHEFRIGDWSGGAGVKKTFQGRVFHGAKKNPIHVVSMYPTHQLTSIPRRSPCKPLGQPGQQGQCAAVRA